jgi:hypothetical protein
MVFLRGDGNVRENEGCHAIAGHVRLGHGHGE